MSSFFQVIIYEINPLVKVWTYAIRELPWHLWYTSARQWSVV